MSSPALFLQESPYYVAETLLVQIIIVCEILLLLGSIAQFRIFNRDSLSNGHPGINPTIQRWYFAAVLLGLFTLISADWFALSGYFNIQVTEHDLYCEIAVIFTNICLITYFGTVTLFYLNQIAVTFKGSQFAVSQRTLISIQLLTFLIILICIGSYVYFHLLHPDFNEELVTRYCNGNWTLPESVWVKGGKIHFST